MLLLSCKFDPKALAHGEEGVKASNDDIRDASDATIRKMKIGTIIVEAKPPSEEFI